MGIDVEQYSSMTQKERDRLTDQYLLEHESGHNNKEKHEYSYLTMKQQGYRTRYELQYWDSRDYEGWDTIRA